MKTNTIWLHISISFFLFSVSNGRSIDLQKELQSHSTCRGKTVIPPPEYLFGFTAALSQCSEFRENEWCQRVCIAHKYPELVKSDRLNMQFIKKEARRLDLPQELDEVKEKALKRVEYCDQKLGAVPFPKSKDDDCKKAEEYYDCMESKYQEYCSSKGPIQDDSFLDM